MNISEYAKVQNIAKLAHEALVPHITPDSTEQTIALAANTILRELGILDTWYHNVLAFVLLGSRSCASMSGREYTPSDEPVGDQNLVTVDLSPLLETVWGDCARSFFVESGVCTLAPKSKEFKCGLNTELDLHHKMKQFVTPDTRFSDLFDFGNELIIASGYENLDFLGNLGHSIEVDPGHRMFIDKNCHEPLGSVKLFTFEPHIKRKGGEWGFKHENIYYFDTDRKVVEL